MAADLVSVAWTAGVTLVVVFSVVVIGGFAALALRRGRQGPDDELSQLQQRANIMLVRVDDTVSSAEDELGFAIAQFGEEQSREFERALDDAKAKVREAFGLQQKLDDAYPETPMQRRDMSSRIVLLCESAQRQLDDQIAAFGAMRHRDSTAPQNVAAARRLIAATVQRRTRTAAIHSALRSDYAPRAVAAIVDNLALADAALADASTAADSAEAAISRRDGTADAAIRSAEEHARRAEQLLDAIEALGEELKTATAAVADLTESTRANLADARALRDRAPDPDSADAVAAAIESVDRVLATSPEAPDPLDQLERLRRANAALDTSMAGARNQQRRLEGARTALAGALVQAHSQLATTRDYITTRRAAVGAAARTRLAESERLLLLAENESDPVAALDLARSSLTHSRDADALARYDLMHR